MINAIFRPVETWPGTPTPSNERQRGRFSVGYLRMLDDLEAELDRISAINIVIQIFLDRKEIRNDGWPRAGVKPSQPGVILTFEREKVVLSYPCDTFLDWQQNLRAISLTLRGLRLIDDYGVTRNNEQYKGFAQIEARKPSVQAAVDFLAQYSHLTPEQVTQDLTTAYRAAARRLHPDQGGSVHLFAQLTTHYNELRS